MGKGHHAYRRRKETGPAARWAEHKRCYHHWVEAEKVIEGSRWIFCTKCNAYWYELTGGCGQGTEGADRS
jgi:hypothetical protein